MLKSPSIKTWRAIALPVEHGSWSFWLEPVLLGFLVAPSIAGLWLIGASLAIFLIRQPLKIVWTDRQRQRRYQRTRLAERFVGLYVVIAVVMGLIAFVMSPAADFLLPFLLVSPLVIVQVYFDVRHESRHWLPEVTATIILASIAASIGLLGGWPLLPALALSVIIITRAVPTVFYVRARLRLEKGQAATAMISTTLHVIALIVLVIFTWLELIPLLSVIAGLMLLARAVHGLSRWRRPARPQIIGVQEIVFGLITITMAGLGFV